VNDATFELTDAVLFTYATVADFLCPVFRPGWPSIYEALETQDPSVLNRLYVEQMQSRGGFCTGDHTVWPRPDAVTLQERTIEHQATRSWESPDYQGQELQYNAWVPS